jgi:adenosine kinase
MSIIVTGSIAFDNIMDFPGKFADHILPDKIHILNVSFLVKGLKKQRGGTAGNIAYTLGLLGDRPLLFSTAGQDFAGYQEGIASAGVDTSAVRILPDDFTAICYITTDEVNNQITGFYPGAMARDRELSLHDLPREALEMLIISPTEPPAIVRFSREAHAMGVPYVYAPGQQIISLEAKDLAEGIEMAHVVIANDYEYEMIRNKTGLTARDMLSQDRIVITTKGEHGSVIQTRDTLVEIPIAPPGVVVDPTGAGDAYCAGVVYGLQHGFDLGRAGRIGALAATYVIESYGTQAHTFTHEAFATRYAASFGEEINL